MGSRLPDFLRCTVLNYKVTNSGLSWDMFFLVNMLHLRGSNIIVDRLHPAYQFN